MKTLTSNAAIVDYRTVDTGQAPVGFFDSRHMTMELSRAELFEDALAAAAGLAHHRVSRGDRIILLLPTSPDYLTVLLACLLSGVAPCTVAPPPKPQDSASAGTRHLAAAINAVRPSAVIVADARTATAIPPGLPALTVDDLRGYGSLPVSAVPKPEPDDPHHIQLTSGSTSAPKAVVLTHANVAANLAVLEWATEMRPHRDRLFVWLPLYHDMGLVQVLLTLTRGAGLDLMAPVGFVRDPLSWLRHMGERGTTMTAAPPFAYRTAADRYASRPDTTIDLSRLRQAYVGAEPIPVAVLQKFQNTFTECGLAADVIVPCYGMAETVLATSLALDVGPTSDTSFGRVRWRHFDRASLDERHIAAPAIPGRPTRTIVSCGPTVPGLTLRITDETGREIGEDQIGAIHVQGNSVMAGYLTDGDIDAPPGGWHDTGDLGLRHDGDLYVVGRSKEMLIIRGRNLPPYDVESVIEEHPQVDAGASAVFSYPAEDKGTAPIVAVIETRATSPDWPTIRTEVTTAVREVFGLSLTAVVIVPRGGIPRTSSGKRQRSALRNAYLAGHLS
ncbi:AMP-binding protein [Solwaraspora sp. WMMD1047]|uniref:AMP-binding protein n=1 Tax=Solwaraspora sp. WMMD1047 TaxID=3016102 RepID=UPI0024167FC4|nr:AMP-binding protein [Solwaraspora sp. WMMD1047]MDG4834226.1 AMP-binding protein [Solwaraspora sp. WMMD1047]